MLRYYPPKECNKLPDPGWIDLVDPDQIEVDLVRDRFGIAIPSPEDLGRIETSSRLRVDGETLFMSAPLLSGTSTDHWKTAPVGFILTPNLCITVRHDALEVFKEVEKIIAAQPHVRSVEVFIFLLEAIVDRAADHLERASDVINGTSQAIFFDESKQRKLSKKTSMLHNVMRKVGQVSDRTSRVRYAFLSIGRMATFVLDRCSFSIEPDLRERLETIRHDIASLDDFETSLSARVQLLQDSAAGFINIEQNDVVKVLTVVSVVGVPPVLVVGVYGMNFRHMPELGWLYGYPFALGLCLLSIVLPLIWFKWRDWM
jgi:magnesium transporter